MLDSFIFNVLAIICLLCYFLFCKNVPKSRAHNLLAKYNVILCYYCRIGYTVHRPTYSIKSFRYCSFPFLNQPDRKHSNCIGVFETLYIESSFVLTDSVENTNTMEIKIFFILFGTIQFEKKKCIARKNFSKCQLYLLLGEMKRSIASHNVQRLVSNFIWISATSMRFAKSDLLTTKFCKHKKSENCVFISTLINLRI